jgi:hypothetical protein
MERRSVSPITLKVMLAGEQAPGKAIHARKVKGYGPDEQSLVLQVGTWAWG